MSDLSFVKIGQQGLEIDCLDFYARIHSISDNSQEENLKMSLCSFTNLLSIFLRRNENVRSLQQVIKRAPNLSAQVS